MPRRHRLARPDFAALQRGDRPCRLHGRLFSLSIAPLSAAGAAKAACVVSKKIAHTAAVRNRIRRRWRAAVSPLFVELPRGSALIFYAKREAAEAAYAEIAEDVRTLLSRATMRRT